MMVHTDGTGYHVHNITDFSAGNATVQLVEGLDYDKWKCRHLYKWNQ